VRAIQGAFFRLKDAIPVEENGESKACLSLVPLLYNFHLETVGLNQIWNTCCIGWSGDADFFVTPQTATDANA